MNIPIICTESRQWFHSIFFALNFLKQNMSLSCCTQYSYTAEYCLLGCDAMWSGRYVPPFQRSMLLPFSWQSSILMVKASCSSETSLPIWHHVPLKLHFLSTRLYVVSSHKKWNQNLSLTYFLLKYITISKSIKTIMSHLNFKI